MSVPAIAGGFAAAPLAFTGRDGAFRRLVARGALLELVTFGFYRFWLTTDIRRHLWSRTEIDGDALEYTGRGKELLYGFLIAMAVLAPVFFAYFLIGLEFERYKSLASLPLYGLLLVFGQFAVYRARRYRLTRTVWRGVRFWMTGSGWSYAWRSILWGLLLVPSLGLAYPWRMAALERYKLRHTHYGNLPGRFAATGWQLFKRVWWVWLLGLLPLLLFVGAVVEVAVTVLNALPPAAAHAHTANARGAAGIALVIGLLGLFALPFLHAIRRAKEWKWWAEGIRFSEVAVSCRLGAGSLIGIYWKLIGLALLVLVGYAAVAGGATAAVGWKAMLGHLAAWGFGAHAAMYLLALVGFGVLARIYALQRVWRRVIESCAVVNIAGAADVAAEGDSVSGFGEGLADGLDFGF